MAPPALSSADLTHLTPDALFANISSQKTPFQAPTPYGPVYLLPPHIWHLVKITLLACFIMLCLLSLLAATFTTRKAATLAMEVCQLVIGPDRPRSSSSEVRSTERNDKKKNKNLRATQNQVLVPPPQKHEKPLQTFPTLFVTLLSLTKHIPVAVVSSPRGLEVLRWFFHVPRMVAVGVVVHGVMALTAVLAIWVLLVVRAVVRCKKGRGARGGEDGEEGHEEGRPESGNPAASGDGAGDVSWAAVV